MRTIIGGLLLLLLSSGGLPVLAAPAAVTHIWFESPSEITEGGKLINDGQAEKGIALIKRVMDKGLPNDIRAVGYTNLCGGYLHLDRYKKAIQQCRRAIKLNTTIWQAFSNRGVARFALGRYAEAVEDFRRALELDPDNPSLTENLALAEKSQRSIRKH